MSYVTCPLCLIECVEVDNPIRREIRPRRGLEHHCQGGVGCLCGRFPRAASSVSEHPEEPDHGVD
jgi:hypothetical protein